MIYSLILLFIVFSDTSTVFHRKIGYPPIEVVLFSLSPISPKFVSLIPSLDSARHFSALPSPVQEEDCVCECKIG